MMVGCILATSGFCDTISGFVKSSSGLAVQGAEVRISMIPETGKPKTVITTKSGAFSLSGLETGYYSITARKKPFLEETLHRIEVNEAKYGKKTFSITLLRPGSVSGYVYDPEGAVIRNAKVNETRSNAKGFYRLTGLRPGEHSLSAEASGYAQGRKHNIRIIEEKETGGIDFTLMRAGEVAGKIEDSVTRKPIADAYLYLQGIGNASFGNATTRKDGTFLVTGLLPGRYTLFVWRQGYEEGKKEEILVEERKRSDIPTFTLQLRPKYFSLFTRNWTFLPQEKTMAVWNAFRVPQVSFELYRIDLADILSRFAASPKKGIDDLFQEIEINEAKPVIKKEVKISYPKPLTEIYNRRVFFDPLPEGLYLVRATADMVPEQRHFFLVTDLSIILKQEEKKTILFLSSLATGRPWDDATVECFDAQWKKTAQLTSGPDGIVTLPEGSVNGIARKGVSIAFFQKNEHFYRLEEAAQKKLAYVVTDRPAYRPGQEVFFKGIVRESDGADYSLVHDRDLFVQVFDAEGTLFSSLEPSFFSSSCEGSFLLPEEPSLGHWRIEMKDKTGTMLGSATFFTLEYRKPEFFIELTPEKNLYLPNETVRVHCNARYYFGAPVKERRFSWALYRSAYWDEEWSGEEGGMPWGYGELFLSGEGETDAEGNAEILFPSGPSFDRNGRFVVEVRMSDSSMKEVRAVCSMKAMQGAFTLGLSTNKYLYEPAEEITLSIQAMDHNGLPEENLSVRVEVAKERYDAKKKRYYYEKISTYRVRTDKEGKSSCSLLAPDSGFVRIFCQAPDRFHNLVTREEYLWVAGKGYTSSWYGRKELEIVSDKKSYHSGETAKLLINTAKADSSLLFTVEGNALFLAKHIPIKGHSVLVEIPLPEEYVPAVYISVCAVSSKTFSEAVTVLPVSAKEKILSVEVSAQKDRFLPGESIEYTIQTKDQKGRAISAECSIGVVDEAIYAIAPEQGPAVEDFFYGRKPNRVSTTYSFYEWAYGGASKDRGDEGLRKNFKDTAYWNPRIITGAEGTAKVSFMLPDNLTTWRATVRAVTPETLVGTGKNYVIASKPLLVRSLSPRFFVEDDRLIIGGIVHNYSESSRRVKVQLEAEGLELLESGYRESDIMPGGLKRFDWNVKVPGLERAIVKIQAGDGILRDAMETIVPVVPYGRKVVEVRAGELSRPVQDDFLIPSTAVERTLRLSTILSSSLSSTILDGIEHLATYPYGCVEQMVSRFAPLLYADKTLSLLTVKGSDSRSDEEKKIRDMKDNLPDLVKKSLSRLYALQRDDGGWGWWDRDNSSLWVSSYVLFGLEIAYKSGFVLEKARLEKGKKFLLQEMLRTTDLNSRAFAAYVLALAGEKPSLEDLWKNRDSLMPYGKALLSLALREKGDDRAVAALENLYQYRVSASPFVSYWKGKREGYYSWMDSDFEATAWALRATVAIDPSRKEIPGIVRYLLTNRKGIVWNSTKDTAAILFAMIDWAKVSGEVDSDCVVSLRVDGHETAKRYFSQSLSTLSSTEIQFRPSLPDSGRIVLDLEKSGSGPLYYSHLFSYMDRAISFVPQNHGFAVGKSYQRQRMRQDGSFVWEDLSGPVAAGDLIRVTISLSGKEGYEYVMIEDPLPSGCEVVSERNDGDEWGWWYGRREVHDEKILFFASGFGASQRRLSYYIRPEFSGMFHILPCRAAMVYFPEIWGSSEGFLLRVEKP